mmetsp:Transcript_25085/g.77347  ORF Transcript_25085/g.77347 Transcript_25085/m.77347 type:complete len:514 (-) Transcript_25085:70-1611(-)
MVFSTRSTPLLLLTRALAARATQDRIRHVVVLYEENRAFDHFFGHHKSLNVNGLQGNESNPVKIDEPEGERVTVYDGAPYVAIEQPQHGYDPYQTKMDIVDGVPRMDGFVQVERETHDHDDNHSIADAVMQGFSEGALPISATLAAEFGIFDRWHTAFPGPSWPNHMFSYSATANGITNTGDGYRCVKDATYPQRTIFDNLLDNGHDYLRVYNDSTVDAFVASFGSKATKNRTRTMDDFFARAAAGTLPALTWIDPRQGINKTLGNLGGPNSDHPSCCDVALGERLRKDIYEALRSGPGWNHTVFLMTWDDAGGFFDHVLPPMSAPPPDDQPACFCSADGTANCSTFEPYSRLGSRVPVVVASPWVKKGSVISEPKVKPANDSQYDGTSIVSTIKRLYDLPNFLTKRDAWSAPFDWLFDELDEPRTDAPMHLPDAPAPIPRPGGHPWGTDCDDPTRRMRRSIETFESLLGEDAPSRLHACAAAKPHWLHTCEAGTMAEASEWLANATTRWLAM